MSVDEKNKELFSSYYERWVSIYKDGAVRDVTLRKYHMTAQWVRKLISDIRLCDMTRSVYQQLINDYAKHHERQTTMDFHHQLKGAILDAVDEGLIKRDPTRKAIIKGRSPREKKIKYLNQYELHILLKNLELTEDVNWDWFILLIAKTGLRFSEALALTRADFDFAHQTLSINKTWDYKGCGGFLPTKNRSSVRKVQIDWQVGTTLQKIESASYLHTWIAPYPCITSFICRGIHCQRSPPIRTRQHDNDTKNLSPYYSGA